MQTHIKQELATLIRDEALSGKFTLIELAERFNVCTATAYRILNKQNKYSEQQGGRIRVNEVILNRHRQAAYFLYRYLGFGAVEISIYLGKHDDWFYKQVGTAREMKASPSVPIRVLGAFLDIDGISQRAGFYMARFYDEQNAWLVPIKRRGIPAAGKVVPLNELQRKCELMTGRPYE